MDNANSKIPNIIYSDGPTTIGQLNVHQDFLDFKVDNEYCIRNPRRFMAYQRAGYSLYLIDNGEAEDFIRYAALMIKKGSGRRTYWGMDDIPMNESGAREFEATLTPQSLSFISQLCKQQMNNQLNCNRNMKTNKKVVRLTESKLKEMIAESVKRVLKEYGETPYGQYRIGQAVQRAKVRGDMNKAKELEDWAKQKSKKDKRTNFANIAYDFNDGMEDQKRLMNADNPNEYDKTSKLVKGHIQNLYNTHVKVESVKRVLKENSIRKEYFVADDGDGILNPFSIDMFDEKGYLEGYEGEDGYIIEDFDIIRYFNTWEQACAYYDRIGN